MFSFFSSPVDHNEQWTLDVAESWPSVGCSPSFSVDHNEQWTLDVAESWLSVGCSPSVRQPTSQM